MKYPKPSSEILQIIKNGVVIPASPLALNAKRQLDEKHQSALYRYYAAAGVGGIAIGVHTTQFEIREPKYGLFQPLLELTKEEIDKLSSKQKRPIVKVGGVCGKTSQAIKEAALLSSLHYDLALLSLGAMKDVTENELIEHCKKVAQIIPIIGFYLQPAVGGRILPYSFWRKFVEIENVIAIKIAPFNRYQTLDVIRAVALADREKEITLYTGNDDNIIMDLLNPYPVIVNGKEKILRIKGGLLGQWSVWTKKAVELLDEIHRIIEHHQPVPAELLKMNIALTDANSVIFDAAHQFAGCIPGIHEILKRQGLVKYTYCLNPQEKLSSGQSKEINRICKDYPELTDDDFVKSHLEEWLR